MHIFEFPQQQHFLSAVVSTNGRFFLRPKLLSIKFPIALLFYLKADDKTQQTLRFCKSSATNAYQILQKNDEIYKIHNIQLSGIK